MKLPGLGASVLIIIAGIAIFYVPGVIAQILYLNGTQSAVTCTDTFCIELVLISFLGIFTVILGVFLAVIAFLNRPKHKTGEENGSAAFNACRMIPTDHGTMSIVPTTSSCSYSAVLET